MDQPLTDTTRSLTLKRVLVCSAATGVVIFAANRVTETRRLQARDACFARFRNVNEALNLYRADADGFSPAYDRKEVVKPDLKLARYSGGKSLACPYDAQFHAMTLRLATGGIVSTVPFGTRTISLHSMFGTEDSSVTATCENHLKHKFRFNVPGVRESRVYPDPPTGGSYVALLRNGTAKFVPFDAKFDQWMSRGGLFVRPKDRPKSWNSFGNAYIFDFEPMPPKFER